MRYRLDSSRPRGGRGPRLVGERTHCLHVSARRSASAPPSRATVPGGDESGISGLKRCITARERPGVAPGTKRHLCRTCSWSRRLCRIWSYRPTGVRESRSCAEALPSPTPDERSRPLRRHATAPRTFLRSRGIGHATERRHNCRLHLVLLHECRKRLTAARETSRGASASNAQRRGSRLADRGLFHPSNGHSMGASSGVPPIGWGAVCSAAAVVESTSRRFGGYRV